MFPVQLSKASQVLTTVRTGLSLLYLCLKLSKSLTVNPPWFKDFMPFIQWLFYTYNPWPCPVCVCVSPSPLSWEHIALPSETNLENLLWNGLGCCRIAETQPLLALYFVTKHACAHCLPCPLSFDTEYSSLMAPGSMHSPTPPTTVMFVYVICAHWPLCLHHSDTANMDSSLFLLTALNHQCNSKNSKGCPCAYYTKSPCLISELKSHPSCDPSPATFFLVSLLHCLAL